MSRLPHDAPRTSPPMPLALRIVGKACLAFAGLVVGAILGLFLAGTLGWLPNLC